MLAAADALNSLLHGSEKPKGKQAPKEVRKTKETLSKNTKQAAKTSTGKSTGKKPGQIKRKSGASTGSSQSKTKGGNVASKVVKSKKVSPKTQNAAKSKNTRGHTPWKNIPKSVQNAYAEGCSRCRYRAYCTKSCWVKRGYTP